MVSSVPESVLDRIGQCSEYYFVRVQSSQTNSSDMENLCEHTKEKICKYVMFNGYWPKRL